MTHLFDLPETSNIHSEIFADSSSYVNPALDGCAYNFELLDLTGISASTQGRLHVE
jgi:hypothetical protein